VLGLTNRTVPPPGTVGAVPEERALGDEDSRRPRAADELVRGDEDRVLVGEVAVLELR